MTHERDVAQEQLSTLQKTSMAHAEQKNQTPTDSTLADQTDDPEGLVDQHAKHVAEIAKLTREHGEAIDALQAQHRQAMDDKAQLEAKLRVRESETAA